MPELVACRLFCKATVLFLRMPERMPSTILQILILGHLSLDLTSVCCVVSPIVRSIEPPSKITVLSIFSPFHPFAC